MKPSTRDPQAIQDFPLRHSPRCRCTLHVAPGAMARGMRRSKGRASENRIFYNCSLSSCTSCHEPRVLLRKRRSAPRTCAPSPPCGAAVASAYRRSWLMSVLVRGRRFTHHHRLALAPSPRCKRRSAPRACAATARRTRGVSLQKELVDECPCPRTSLHSPPSPRPRAVAALQTPERATSVRCHGAAHSRRLPTEGAG
jgi:hypothetical protein